MLDTFLFSILPYMVILTAIVGVTYRLRSGRFGVSSLSSQFLESRELFFGSVPWHYGILTVLTGHFIGFLFPSDVLAFNSVPVRLYILEVTGLLFGLMSLVGIVSLLVRRVSSPRIRAVTSTMDMVLLLVLATQVVTGLWTAIFNRWGSMWFASSAVPYLWSVFWLRPDTATIAPLPWSVKLHILGFYVMLGILPFSRLIHALIPPIKYLWRPYELVIWYRRRPTAVARHTATQRPRPELVRVVPPTLPQHKIPALPTELTPAHDLYSSAAESHVSEPSKQV